MGPGKLRARLLERGYRSSFADHGFFKPPRESLLSGRPRARYVLEVFGGGCRLSAACHWTGLHTIGGLDLQIGDWHDLSDPRVQSVLQRWFRAGLIWFIWWGTPCTPWSQARQGRPTSHPAHCLAAITVKLMEIAHKCGILQALENPLTSGLWKWPPMKRMLERANFGYVQFPMCAYGAAYRKWTQIATTAPGLLSLSRSCTCTVPHERLQGKVNLMGV